MILKQYYLGCLAHASYLVADEESHTAAVVDPRQDVEQYVEDALRLDTVIRYVFLTHFHADFVAGHLELRNLAGAAICLGARAKASLAEQLGSAEPPVVLDVRAPREWEQRHISGARNIPLNHLPERLAELPRDRRVVVHCQGGYRSSLAASILERHGFQQTADLTGGIAAWEASGLPVSSSTFRKKAGA